MSYLSVACNGAAFKRIDKIQLLSAFRNNNYVTDYSVFYLRAYKKSAVCTQIIKAAVKRFRPHREESKNILVTLQRHFTESIRHNGTVFEASADEVYGDLPLDRPDLFFTETTPIHTSSPYSASKASADLLVMAYHRTFGTPATISRCSNNYGPYQFPEKLIPLMISKALADENLPVYGEGLNVRDWLYVDDHCKAIDMILENGKIGEVYNIGGHNEKANIDVVKTILKAVGKNESLITFVKDRPGHDMRYAIDPSKIHAELGWYPETLFNDGIRKTIDWYLNNREWWQMILSGEYKNYRG